MATIIKLPENIRKIFKFFFHKRSYLKYLKVPFNGTCIVTYCQKPNYLNVLYGDDNMTENVLDNPMDERICHLPDNFFKNEARLLCPGDNQNYTYIIQMAEQILELTIYKAGYIELLRNLPMKQNIIGICHFDKNKHIKKELSLSLDMKKRRASFADFCKLDKHGCNAKKLSKSWIIL